MLRRFGRMLFIAVMTLMILVPASELAFADTSLSYTRKLETGVATIKGKTTEGITFEKIYVSLNGSRTMLDDTDKVKGKQEIEFTYDTKKLNIGIYDLYAEMSDGSEVKCPFAFFVSPTEVPSLSQSCFETYYNAIEFRTPNHNAASSGGYVLYYSNGGAWDKYYGPLAAGSKTTLAKLKKANTKYTFKARYEKQVEYNSGQMTLNGPWSKEVTVKTGPSKIPAIKSVTTTKAAYKKVNVKPIYDALGNVIAKGYTAWQTEYTVVIRFKKKPGIKGLYIWADGGTPMYTYVKGNKTKYTAKFNIGGKWIGKKVTVKAYAKTNNVYSAYSKTYKNTKVKVSR